MKTNTPVITPAETAYLLRQHLGPLRAWADFLTDNIRGRQSVEGITLKPCAKANTAPCLAFGATFSL